MKITRFIAAPRENIAATGQYLQSPYQIAPEVPHPWLTIGDLFAALETLLLGPKSLFLQQSATFFSITAASFEDFLENGIFSLLMEKQGALYAIFSIELQYAGGHEKFALVLALHDEGRKCLNREYAMLSKLVTSRSVSYLPKVYAFDRFTVTGSGNSETGLLLICQWLDGYYEFHLTAETDSDRQAVLWDYRRGHRFLARHACSMIFQQSAMILCYYYDFATGEQIYPWHHAAGDFIVRHEQENLQIKLSTVRNYQALLTHDGPFDSTAGLLHFFLHIVLRMRLDKQAGTGDIIWAERYTVTAAITGFLAGLRQQEKENRRPPLPLDDFVTLLASFSAEEFAGLYQPLLRIYASESESDLQVISANLSEHCRELEEIFKNG